MHINLIATKLCNELVEEKKGLELEVALLKDKIFELKKVLNVVLAEPTELMTPNPSNFLLRGSLGETLEFYDDVSSLNMGLQKGDFK